MLPELSQALADRYRVERELGRGGMATVHLAHDLRNDQPVALKVLHPQLAFTLGADRFAREIRVAARLDHPNILRVLDSGDIGGQLWFAMPYVEGESLYERLQRERQLPTDEALRIAFAVASALAYANEQGVVHRDIKPDNIMLSGDGVLVADFGVARAVSEMQSKLTATGMIVGTPTYMSPEQAAGEPNLDGRSDIFALACVIYEMLAGEPPFKGPTPQMTLMLRLMQPARPLRPMVSVTEEVESAILRALAKDPAERWATAADFADALAGKHSAASTTSSTTFAGTSTATGGRAGSTAVVRRFTHRRRATRLPPRVTAGYSSRLMASKRNPFVLRLHVCGWTAILVLTLLVAVLLWSVSGGNWSSTAMGAAAFLLVALGIERILVWLLLDRVLKATGKAARIAGTGGGRRSELSRGTGRPHGQGRAHLVHRLDVDQAARPGGNHPAARPGSGGHVGGDRRIDPGDDGLDTGGGKHHR